MRHLFIDESLESRLLFAFEAVSSSVLVTEGVAATHVIRLHLTAPPASSFVATVQRISGDTNISVVDSSVTFDANNWRADKYVRLQAANDADTTAGAAVIQVSGGGQPTLNITATEKDDDVAQGIELSSSSIVVPEGRTSTARVRLASRPVADVIVNTSGTSGDMDLVVEGHASLTFNSSNWDRWQWVSFVAANDGDTSAGSATFEVSASGLVSQTLTVNESDLGNPLTPGAIETTIDDYEVLPLQGQSSWNVNRMGGDRGVIGSPAAVTFGRGYVDVQGTGNGVYTSLSHVGAEQVPVNLQALLPAQILPAYQYRATGIKVDVLEGSGTFRMELKDANNSVIWSFEKTLFGGPNTVAMALPNNLGNAQYFNWLMVGGVGANVRVAKATMFVSGPKIGYVEDFLWPYATLLANYDATSGLVRDGSIHRAGEFDGINGTGALAAATALAAQLGIVSTASAQQIVSTISNRLISLQSTASNNGVIAHFVRKSGATFIPVTGSEYSSIDTSIALLFTMLASQSLGLPTAGLQQAIQNVNWSALTLGNGSVSMGFTSAGTLIGTGWDWFGTESLLVAMTFAAAKGFVPAIPNVSVANPSTFDGSGFIDEMLWEVAPVVGHDVYGPDLDIYRTTAALNQLDHYDNGPAPVFGASAGEVPIKSQVPPSQTYHAYGMGLGGDGSNVFAAPVELPHYAGMIWSLFPADARRMFDHLTQSGMLTPLNMVESLTVQTWSGQVESHWNAFKGSWNTGLWALGAGRALLAGTSTNPLFEAMKSNAFLNAGYQLVRNVAQNLNAGNKTVVFDQPRTLDSVVVGSAGDIIVRPGGLNLLRTAGLTISAGGTIDLADNDMIVDYTGTSPMDAIESLIASARNGGDWLGAGLTSSSARDNPAQNTTLGAIEASDYRVFHGQNATFGGQTPGTSAVLVKYTYYGDANFSGSVNFDDYVRIDVGFNSGLTGWSNGDFNYSDSVNFDDYVLIDVSFNTQGVALGRKPVGPAVRPRPAFRR